MTRSLSVLLPVHNLQSSLSASVHEILEVLAELTSQFELLIVDDGSTDGTWEVARELAQLYPQVRLLCEVVGQGMRERRSYVRDAQGDVVITHDGLSPIDATEIVRLWRSLLAPTKAPKFLAAAGLATSGRSMPMRGQRGWQSAGFSILRPATINEVRREVTTSGVR